MLPVGLNPNSNNPLFYKDFKLTIEYDPNNTFSFASRRVKGYKSDGNITLYNLDDGDDEDDDADYSFAASPEVLVKEIKYKIDQYLLEGKYNPIGFPGDINGQKIGYKGKIYQWNKTLDEWGIIPNPTFKAIVIRSTFKKVHINLRGLEVYSNEFPNVYTGGTVNWNILPTYGDRSKTQFLDWPTRTYRAGWIYNNKEAYPASNIIDSSTTKNLTVHTNQNRDNKDNTLIIPLTRSFNLSSITKVSLYNRIKATENISERRIDGFQIEFYKNESDVSNSKSPVFIIPITGVQDKYDFFPQQIRELQSL